MPRSSPRLLCGLVFLLVTSALAAAQPAMAGTGCGHTFSLSSSTYNVDEGQAVTVTVVNSYTSFGSPCTDSSVEVATADGSAHQPADYIQNSTTLFFTGGQSGSGSTAQSFIVQTVDNGAVTGPLTFSVALSNAQGFSDFVQLGSPSSATVTINDLDTAPGGSGGSSGSPGSPGQAFSPFPPTVGGVSPNSGPAGTSVGITGDNFDTAKGVFFGNTAANFVVDGYKHITASVPAGAGRRAAAGNVVDVRVVNANGTSLPSAADQFTITGVSGAGGPAAQPKVICAHVPSLKRHTLRGSKGILRRAGCLIPLYHKGHARRPPSHVKSQSVPAGTTLYEGSKLTVRLG